MDKTPFDVGFDDETGTTGLLDDNPDAAARPYPGGRAQAESGSKIIESDFFSWLAKALDPPGLSPDHPRVVQLGEAWRAVSKLGLGDDPGAASIRYHVLAHAAGALIEPVKDGGFTSEADALLTLQQHALIHGRRLYATSIDLFTRSGKSGPYTGRAEAASGSRILQIDYRRWLDASGGAFSDDPAPRNQVAVLRQAWAGVERHDLADGPEPSATRYQRISGCARDLAGDPGHRLPSALLNPLLVLAIHADKHSIRLHSTASARTGDTVSDYEALCQATWERPAQIAAVNRPTAYRSLPDQIATAAARGHSEVPRDGQATAPVSRPAAPHVRKQVQQRET